MGIEEVSLPSPASSTRLYIVPKGSQGESTRFIVHDVKAKRKDQQDRHWNEVMSKMQRIQTFLERYRSGDRFSACWRCFRSSGETILCRLCITCDSNDECYPLWFICNDCVPPKSQDVVAHSVTDLNADLYFCPYHIV